MKIHRPIRVPVRRSLVPICSVLLGAAGATSCGANAESNADDPETGQVESAIYSGSPTTLRPEIGKVWWGQGAGASGGVGAGGSGGVGTGASGGTAAFADCTGTLVHPQWVVAAASCFGYQTGAVNASFTTMPDSPGVEFRQITYAHSVGTTNDAKNIAFGRLSSPSSVPPASIATASPVQGSTATAFGYGCLLDGVTWFGKLYREFPFGQATNFNCVGDEGGPRVSGAYNATSAPLWGVTGKLDGTGTDKVGDLVQYGLPYARGLAAFGRTTIGSAGTNTTFANLIWAANVRPVSGDFNGDGLGDFALLGVSEDTIPVAFGTATGTFTYSNVAHASFPNWAIIAKSMVTGDFDGDGDSDIALVGGPNWSSMPVAYSNRDGTFTIANEPGAQFATWAAVPGAYAVAADLSGDGVTDIALVGGSGWTSVPIQLRRPGGVQEIINPGVSPFPSYSRGAGVRAHAARLAGTTADSLVLVGMSGMWLFSARLAADGVTLTQGLNVFPTEANTWSRVPGVRTVVADYNGDGLSDFAFIGAITNPPPKYQPFVLNRGNNGFDLAFLPIPDLPAFGQNSRFALPLRRSGTTANDVALLGIQWDPLNIIPIANLRP